MMERAISFGRLARAVDGFCFTPASARPLAALRVGLAAVLIVQALSLRAQALEFLAHDGIVQGDLVDVFATPGVPRIAWLTERLLPLGVSEALCIQAVCAVYLAGLCLLAVGLFTRAAAVVSWLLHWTLMNSAPATIYGVDLYAHIFLFYLMWVPAGRAFSLDVALGRLSSRPSAGARLALRALQIHLCLSYLTSGIAKASGVQWWNGELLFRALSLPGYKQFDMSWIAYHPWISLAGGWATLLIEIGYCVFIWPRRTRRLWIAGVVALHLGIAVFLGLHLFGAVMCVLTVALFGFSPDTWASKRGSA